MTTKEIIRTSPPSLEKFRENLPSKGTIKRKIVETSVFHIKDASTSMKIPNQPVLDFGDSVKVGGVPNDIFPLVITTTIG